MNTNEMPEQIWADNMCKWSERLNETRASYTRTDLIEKRAKIAAEKIGEKCPNCNDVGWHSIRDRSEVEEQIQCEWCHTIKNSIFNMSAIILNAMKGNQ